MRVRDLRLLLRLPKAGTEEEYFNHRYYSASYPDVAASGQSSFSHYMKHGWREGRNPSADFITLYYRDKHLNGRPINPLTHFVNEGRQARLPTKPADAGEYLDVQKRVVRPYFDPSGYSAVLDGAEDDPLSHYLRRGWREGVPARTTVSIPDHIDGARYVRHLDVSPLYHFASQQRLQSLEKGIDGSGFAGSLDKSGSAQDKASAPSISPSTRRHVKTVVSKEFDPKFYLWRNADVRSAGVDPLDHFIDFGWRENRRPNNFFDPSFYVRANPFLQDSEINPFFHYLSVCRQQGLRANPIGWRAYPAMEAPKEADWDLAVPAADIDRARCVVIMPVYKGYDETLAAIYSILAATQKTPYALYVIDDRSPDSSLSAKLVELAARGLFHLDVNYENLGFVKTVNKGLSRFRDRTVALMNTDAKVSGDWLDRMMAHADRDETIATVTPFSNNATIFSYPLANENNEIEMEVDLAGIDRFAAEANKGRVSEVPVGVGFCMLVSVAARDAIGILDEEAFGRGYGEENDFCLRAAKAGFRNVLAEDVFVYHVGGVSFGDSSDKEPPGQKALIRKHPDYPEQIRQHLRADATETGRMRLDLRRLAASAGPKATVFISHALSGGIVTHVEEETRRLQAEGTSVVLIRVGAGSRWDIEISSSASDRPFTPNLRPMPFTQIREHLADFLRWLSPGLIHIHSFVAFDWAATRRLMDLVRDSGVPYSFMLHDYSAVCHRNDLVLTSNRYCGLADVERCRLCVATDRNYPEATDPAELRETYARFLEGADRVLAPSRDIADRLHRAGAKYAIEVVPHREQPLVAPAPVPAADPSVVSIVTIGAIGAHKGSRVLLNLARDAKARSLPVRYHIVGYSDITNDLAEAGTAESGRFSSPEEAMDWAVSLSPNFIFLPSIWPETWSYTLSIAFALQVPPVVFDIGAPADRIRDEGFGVVLPYALIDDVKALNDRLIELAKIPPVIAETIS